MGCILDKVDELYNEYLELCSAMNLKPIDLCITDKTGQSWLEHFRNLRV